MLIPDALMPDLARIGVTLLPSRLAERVGRWDELDEGQRVVTAGDVRLLAGAVTAARP